MAPIVVRGAISLPAAPAPPPLVGVACSPHMIGAGQCLRGVARSTAAYSGELALAAAVLRPPVLPLRTGPGRRPPLFGAWLFARGQLPCSTESSQAFERYRHEGLKEGNVLRRVGIVAEVPCSHVAKWICAARAVAQPLSPRSSR